MEFEYKLERNIFELAADLKGKFYRHGPYEKFTINDPKRRDVSKATVRDRIVHHAVFKVLTEIFEPTFIANSFSCRVGKGTHKGFEMLERMIRRESRNYTRSCFVLKCDVRKFFDSIDHRVLRLILKKRIKDLDLLWLLEEIIGSFESGFSKPFYAKGVPIGNLTSQAFANIYMNELDQFMKQELKVKNYARYTDDFVIVSEDREYLESLIPQIGSFLTEKLELDLHPGKVFIRKNRQGIDFLGYVSMPHCRLIRDRTRRRILRRFEEMRVDYRLGRVTRENMNQSTQSYLGVLSHANAHKLSEEMKNRFFLG
jgi:retron-type reverse transcriptase